MAKFSRFYSQTTLGTKMENGELYIDYKNVDELRRLLNANGKMLARQRTRLSAKHQRYAAMAVKRARVMALLPYAGELR